MAEGKELFAEKAKEAREYRLPRWDELPELELYMDQVIVCIEKYLGVYMAKGRDRLITSAMINNYVKLGIIPPPSKKKYGKAHLAYLVIICSLKQVLPILTVKQLIEFGITEMPLSKLYDLYCDKQEALLAGATAELEEQVRSLVLPKDAHQLGLMAIHLASAAEASKLMAERILEMLPKEETPEEKPKKAKK